MEVGVGSGHCEVDSLSVPWVPLGGNLGKVVGKSMSYDSRNWDLELGKLCIVTLCML
jgi:hypothetical protein